MKFKASKVLAGVALALGIAVGAFGTTPPIPRAAKEFSVIELSGKQTLLSQVKGKVVVFQFLFTWCPHCQATAKMLSGLQKDLGPKGLQVFGVAFNDEVNDQADLVKTFISQNNVNFPIGRAQRDTVLKYLGIGGDVRFVVPQILVIDRKGQIRAQSDPKGEGTEYLQKEPDLRKLVGQLLAETSK